jgi:23S rRNA pseudouridine1911/1915/1917 synthase
VLDRPIGLTADPESCLMTATLDAREARSARTEFRVLERFTAHTLIEARPITGRHHQIRVHFAGIGHPVVDDEFYGPFGWIKKTPDGSVRMRGGVLAVEDDEAEATIACEQTLVGRHALHAAHLEFRHPITWEPLAFDAPLPADIASAVETLRNMRLLKNPLPSNRDVSCVVPSPLRADG